MRKRSVLRSGAFGIDPFCYVFVAPIVILYVTFSIVPILRTFVESFYSGNMVVRGPFIGIANYTAIIKDRMFQQAFSNSMIFTLFSILFSVSLAVIFAVMINSPRVRFQTAFKVIFFLPVVTSFVATGYIWKWMYNPTMGILNRILTAVGIGSVNWLGDPSSAMPSMIGVNIWKWVGYFMIIITAYLQLIDQDLYEAARIDGANFLQVFFKVTLPLLDAAILLCVILATINFLRTFAIVLVMTQGGPGGKTELITTFVYNEAFGTGRMRIGYSAAASMILFVLIMVVTMLLSRVKKEV
jgi:ABC-type sugar transport system permease subunit